MTTNGVRSRVIRRPLTALVLALVVVLAAGLAAVLLVPFARLTARNAATAIGLRPAWNAVNLALASPRTIQMIPADRISARREVIASLHTAMRGQNWEHAARLNSVLAQEAFARALRTLKFWETQRDTETGLVPRGMNFRESFWNAKDTGADLFPHLLVTSQYVDNPTEPLWLDTLRRERDLCGVMPCTVYFRPAKAVAEAPRERVFGASEYTKDGLLAIAERRGRGPWFTRLEEIAESVIRSASVSTSRGNIPSSDTEVNGNMLQVLSRLFWATGRHEYLEMAERIAEAYLLDLLPKSGYLPPSDWDFARAAPASGAYFSLRDHGSEVIAGLSEI
jgi:hypothetical protein